MDNLINSEQGYDAIVIGAGSAGLQAALTLGRMHRPVLVLDSGDYRNAPAARMHNFAGYDGAAPADFRAAARRDLAPYATVELRQVAATSVKGDAEEGFRVDLADGTTAWARRIVLATGVRDTLPDKPGLAALFGTVAAHCPYCHGHEYAGEHVALLGAHAPVQALLIERIAARRTILTDGEKLPEAMQAIVDRAGLAVRRERVTAFEPRDGGAVVRFERGPDEEIGGLFVATTWAQSVPFAEQLGLDLLPDGCLRVDAFQHTSAPGVVAAGDLAHLEELPMPMASVLTAAAAGLVAASTVDRELTFEDAGL